MEFDRNDGVIPEDSAELQRAKRADLVTLPPRIAGTSCANCLYVASVTKTDGLIVGFCKHKAVSQPVTERNCCAFWDAKGVIRAWK